MHKIQLMSPNEFELTCLLEAHRQTRPLVTPTNHEQKATYRRELFKRNMLQGHAKRIMRDNKAVRDRICKGLTEIKGDIEQVVKSLLAVFAGTTLLGYTLTPALLAAIAVVLVKFGLAYFCAA